MNIIKLFKDVPTSQIPILNKCTSGTRFSTLTLEDIRRDQVLFYDFLELVASKYKV